LVPDVLPYKPASEFRLLEAKSARLILIVGLCAGANIPSTPLTFRITIGVPLQIAGPCIVPLGTGVSTITAYSISLLVDITSGVRSRLHSVVKQPVIMIAVLLWIVRKRCWGKSTGVV
jgi:hypothetical protein